MLTCTKVPKFQPRLERRANVCILFLLAGSGKLCCSTCLAGGPSDIGFSQKAGDSYVPAQLPAALPWDECQTTRSLPVCAEQPWWLFCHVSSGWGKTSSDQVIESMVPSRPARCFSAAHERNGTPVRERDFANSSVYNRIGIYEPRTRWAPTVLVSLQPIKSWRWRAWPMNASCNWVDLL